MPKLLLGCSGIVLSSIKSNDTKPGTNISSTWNSESFFGLFTLIRIIRTICVMVNKRIMIEKIFSILAPIKLIFFYIHYYVLKK